MARARAVRIDGPAIDPVARVIAVQAISRLAFCTWTAGRVGFCWLCQGASDGVSGISGVMRSPRITHILPGCCSTGSTARRLSAPSASTKVLQARRMVSALRNGLVGRRIE